MTRRLFDGLMLAPFLQEAYTLGPDSQRQQGVPQGTVTKLTWNASKAYPGTTRNWAVYVPAQYKADKPACVMFFCDGTGFVNETGAWRAPIVFDNLIHKQQMPVTIGVFIDPGVLAMSSEDHQPRFNRSYEYDAVDDRYARFLIEEIFPELRKQYNISTDPNDCAIGGSSSGGIAAFTAAWYRPDTFHRVMSCIGSYTDLRGGHQYPGLIRKTEHKPLRVFLQDGRNDQNIYSGNWYISNQDVASALEYGGYELNFVVGTEGHNSRHGAAIFPEAMRWLWKDWPKPIGEVDSKPVRRYINEILEPGRDWEVVSENHRSSDNLGVDGEGNVYFSDNPVNKTYKAGIDGKVSVFKEEAGGVKFGGDGTAYFRQSSKERVLAFAPNGTERTIAQGFPTSDYTVNAKGEMYFAESANRRIWFMDVQGNRKIVNTQLAFPNGITLSPDQALLMAADYRTKWVWSFQVMPDGSLANGQPFYHLQTLDESSDTGADGLTVDTTGHLYVATKLGIQICDQAGRVVGIINMPDGTRAGNIAFGGPNLEMLYVTTGNKVFRRKLRRTGTLPWKIVKPPRPQL